MKLALPQVSGGARAAVAVVVAVNLVLVGAYLWSRGGQTTHLRLEAHGNEFSAYVDGQLKTKAQFDAPATGGVALSVENVNWLPSLPEPRGVDSVTITDLATGAELFHDDFTDGFDPRWAVSGRFTVDSGVAGLVGDGAIFLPSSTWGDYALDVTYKNIAGATVIVRGQDTRNGIIFSFRPFRQHDSSIALLRDGQVVASAPGGQVDPPRHEAIKSMVAMVLRPYPLIFALLAFGFIAVAGLQLVPLPRLRPPDPKLLERLPWLLAGALAAGGFGVALFLMVAYIQRLPHVQDSVAYVFQAKMLASGHLYTSPPPVPQAFDFETPPFIPVADGKWTSVYPFGHPLALAIGARLGAVWLVPPLLGGATIALTFAIGRKLYGARVGLLAALLMASSPFYFMTASAFMSHNTVTFYLLASLFLLLVRERRPILYSALAGLLFGLAFNARQLETTALIPAYGLLLASGLVPRARRQQAAKEAAAFLAAGLVMLAAYLLYNWITRGGPLTTGFTAAGFQTEIGFGGKHSVTMGIRNEQTQMVFLILVLNGWPQMVGLLFVLLPFVLGSRERWDWFFLGCALIVIGVYALYIGHGIMYGPRYWYPAAPFLMLLAARGADRAAVLLAEGAAAARRALLHVERPPATWAGVLVVYALVAALVGSSISGWLLSRDVAWFGDFVPQQAVTLKGFNRVDDRLVRIIEDADLTNALILVDQCPIWQCYGSVFWLNSPTLDGDIVIAKDLPDYRADLLAAYPDRKVYLASYGDRFLIPYGAARPEPGTTPAPIDDATAAPLAKDITLPTATPAPTPSGPTAAERDAQRRADLGEIAGALAQYRAARGAYPIANGVQSFCRYSGDAGCHVKEVVATLPADPAGGDYWYLSDGRTFFLFASMDEEADSSQCPQPPLAFFQDVANLYCLAGP